MSKKKSGTAEAKRYLQEGDEALKTGLFKWSKDYGSAAFNYEQAAKLFRAANEIDIATRIYEKLIEVNGKLNDQWGIAKNYEAIVTMGIERTDGKHPSPEPLVKWTLQVKDRMGKSHHSYINLVKKVSKYLDDQGDLVEAMNLCSNLLNDLEDDEQFYLRSEMVASYVALLLKIRRYPECINLFEREYTLKKNQAAAGGRANLDTLALTIIVLNIIIADIEKAEKRLQDFAIEIRNFIKTPEFDVAEKLIDFYTEGKQAEFDKVAQRTVLNSIYPLTIIKDLRSVTVQNKDDQQRRGTNMTDAIGATSSISRAPDGQNNFFSSYQGSNANGIAGEEQRQKALDDYLC